ncbi:MAG TPA: BNR-4 repeat-containing protein, partial [Burkholderiaceae bacterium]|nr:BNR-4 repeat-containing protein [Burkholderiaceae bacterium]
MRTLAKHLAILLAAGLLSLSACLEVPPDDLAGTPAPITSARVIGTMARDGQATISLGGYLNGQSFQQDGILTYRGYQYSAYWNAQARLVLVRRPSGDGPWQYTELAPPYTVASGDAHSTISLGVSPRDGRLHVAFDHHSSPLHYVSSVPGMVTAPGTLPWTSASFGPVTSMLGTQRVDQVTYPRFVTAPDGRMLLSYRYGAASGGGDEVLWEYDGTTATWTRIGTYIAGIAKGANAYLHGIEFSGHRLHAAWSWRTTPDPSTNETLLYA